MVTIVTRPQWDARSPSSAVDLAKWSQRTGFVVHYSAANKDQTVRSIQNFHMDSNGWRDIGYNWLVTVDGRVWEGRQHTWDAIGAHVQDHNTENIGCCMIGTDADVTDEAKRSIRWLYDEACRLAGRTLAKRYHSQYASTSCPGNNLRAWVQAGMPISTTEGDDMEQTERLINDTGSPNRTVGNVLADIENLRNWAVSEPGAGSLGVPVAGSVGDLLLQAAQAVLSGSLVDPAAVATELAANETWTQSLADRIAEQITQRPMNVSLELSGTATGQATPVE